PWIFRDIRQFLETGEQPAEITLQEKMDIMLRHGQMLCRYKGERQGMKEMRKNVAWYIKGLPGSAKMRADCGIINQYSDLEKMAKEILSRQ
ncbi:MAG: tRNA-dihydrouridine synthase, partial [Lachnospiraceae bacterium]|nr:tRNA-dihydrouridine synthase [Lachnospiraceae bacterium]